MNLQTLKAAWLEAKAAEQAANARRIEIEGEMLQHFASPDSGEGTVTSKGDGISVAYKMTRSVDDEDLKQSWGGLPNIVKEVFTWKASVSVKTLKALQESNPYAYSIAAKYITAKPAKPSISIKGDGE